jgi:hypothetical protein
MLSPTERELVDSVCRANWIMKENISEGKYAAIDTWLRGENSGGFVLVSNCNKCDKIPIRVRIYYYG